VIRSVPLAILLVSVSCLSLLVLQLLQVFRIRLNLLLRIGMHLFAAVAVVALVALIYDRFVTIR
jgi:inorganic pyrophosphatase/exopolyphosphatase